VTIGIGFKCNDGLVLATDTQYTRGDIKGHGPKLFPLFGPTWRPDLSVLVAGAGRVGFMKSAIEKLEVALGQLADPTLADVKTVTEEVLVDFFEDHIYPMLPSPVHGQFELILAVWTKADGYSLLTTDETTVTTLTASGTAHCSIGTGRTISEYALGLTYQPGLSVDTAKFLAAFCIKAAKDHLGSYGGSTRIWTLKDEIPSAARMRSVMTKEVDVIESGCVDLYDTLRYLMEFLDPASSDDNSVQLITDMVRDTIITFRTKERGHREWIRKQREKTLQRAKQTARAAQQILKQPAT
jgi:20S proteasome alpha/beta subunit